MTVIVIGEDLLVILQLSDTAVWENGLVEKFALGGVCLNRVYSG